VRSGFGQCALRIVLIAQEFCARRSAPRLYGSQLGDLAYFGQRGGPRSHRDSHFALQDEPIDRPELLVRAPSPTGGASASPLRRWQSKRSSLLLGIHGVDGASRAAALAGSTTLAKFALI
jgi:hypothetical protein